MICNTSIYGHSLGVNRDSVQLPRLLKQARKSGGSPACVRAENIWSSRAYRRWVSLQTSWRDQKRTGHVLFSPKAAKRRSSMTTTAIAQALSWGTPQDWPLKDAEAEWGYEMANYGLGSNSRVRGEKARELLGWVPKRVSVIEWIRDEMV